MRNLIINNLRKPDGTYLADEPITITLVDSLGAKVSAVDLSVPGIYATSVEVTTDSTGSATQSLWPNQDSDSVITYYHILAKNYPSIEYVIWLPEGTTDINLTTLLTMGPTSVPVDRDRLDEHLQDTNNPHFVTKSQAGLGNVDNTADVDKPIQNAIEPYIGGTLERNTVLAGGLKLDTVSTKGFGATTYVGNGTFGGQTIPTNVDMLSGTNGGFLWIKNRSTQRDFAMVDSVRSTDNLPAWRETLVSNYDYAELNRSSVAEITSSGFKPGSSNETNQNGDNFIAWSFQTTEKTTGITSVGKPYTAHYNPAMGFSVVGYKTDASTYAGIPHHLGYIPEISIYKNISQTGNWRVHLGGLLGTDGSNNNLVLNSRDGLNAYTGLSDDGSVNLIDLAKGTMLGESVDNDDIITYNFRSVPGFSKITTYVGTGGTENYVDLGLDMTSTSSFVMIKCLTSDNTSWIMVDNARGVGPNSTSLLCADLADVEVIGGNTLYRIDFLDYGIKVVGNSIEIDGAGEQYLIIAFTSNYDRARPYSDDDTDIRNWTNGGAEGTAPSDTNKLLTGVPYVEDGTIVTHAEGFDENGAKDKIDGAIVGDQEFVYVDDSRKYAYIRNTDTPNELFLSTGAPLNNQYTKLDPITMIGKGYVYLGEVKWMDGKAFAIEPAKRTSYTQLISDGTNEVTPAELRAKCDEPYIGLDGELVNARAYISDGVLKTSSGNIAATVKVQDGITTIYFKKPYTGSTSYTINAVCNGNSIARTINASVDKVDVRTLGEDLSTLLVSSFYISIIGELA